jgi:hypothetical protein
VLATIVLSFVLATVVLTRFVLTTFALILVKYYMNQINLFDFNSSMLWRLKEKFGKGSLYDMSQEKK